jgi:hypothetical protein
MGSTSSKEVDMASSNTRSSSHPEPLVEALDKNKQVADTVQEAADELAVVHAVLDTKLPQAARSAEEIARAVAHTNAVENRLSESAKVLDEVNETLEREVKVPKP